MKLFLRPVRNLELELKRLRRWYFATLESYDYTAKDIDDYYRHNKIDRRTRTPLYYELKSGEDEKSEKIDFFIIQHDKRDLINKYQKLGYRKYLAQLVLIQLVSLIEIFLQDQLINCFFEKKEMFYRNTQVSFTVEDFLKKDKELLEREYIEKLTDNHKRSGFKQMIKVYKDYTNITLTDFHFEEVFMGKDVIFTYTDLLKLHDMRHLIVHKLGLTDKNFKINYNYDKKYLSLEEEEVIYYLRLCQHFNDYIKEKVIKFYGKVHMD